ncbi:hypothetical protein B0H16DRAFT_83340 [Mycena metata]|uniref:Uncharacterized protein n=1 Tax=Mycena metata TaxID=1033252 RepID=A0AAD7JZ88_9AGAR|nr:hypothetical protein B0H16DRAFT_83340 [Mycena metata]
MPSLRRSSSTPSVRPAPYALLSPVPGPRVHGSGHRRSTGSETSNRRVLADIVEWWRVSAGQRDDVVPQQELEEHDLDQDHEDDLHQAQVLPNGTGGQFGAERPVTPVPWASHSPGAVEMPVVEMAALSIAPTTPRRHALESSTSSLESTPEVSHVQAEHPHLDLGALNLGPQDPDVPLPVITRARSGTLPPPPPLHLRAHSFADFASYERQYADFAMSPLSSPPIFSN